MSGNIIALYADFNPKVKKGRLVAEIDPAPFKAAVDQAKATLNAAKAAVVTAEATLAKSQSDLAGADANGTSQKVNVVKAQSALDLARVENERRIVMLKTDATSMEDADTAQANYDQAVASLDAAQAAVVAAQAAADSARKQVDVASIQLLQAKAVVEQDSVTLAQAQLNLEHTRIYAPVDGTVESLDMNVGQTVAASFQAPTIFLIAQDLTKMQVDTNVDESDVASSRRPVGHLCGGCLARTGLPGARYHRFGKRQSTYRTWSRMTSSYRCRMRISSCSRHDRKRDDLYRTGLECAEAAQSSTALHPRGSETQEGSDR